MMMESQAISGFMRLTQHVPCSLDGIKDLLTVLKNRGVHILMVTGKGKRSTAISLKHFGLTDFFEVIETGSPDGPVKAQGIQSVLSHLTNIKKEEIIYVGDAESDIIASRKVGVAVVAAAWAATAEPGKLAALKPDKIFYAIADFTNWLYTKI